MAVRLLKLGLLAAGVAGLWAGGLMGFQTSPWAVCTEAAAWERVKDGVRGHLVSPKLAEFPDLAAVRIERHGACSFRVAGFVDSSNLMGVLLRADFSALVAQDDQGALRVEVKSLITRGSLSAPTALAAVAAR